MPDPFLTVSQGQALRQRDSETEMNTNLFIGIGAGLASALLFLSVTTGNPAAVMLFYAAPLPLFIAGFGWGLFPTLVAAASNHAGASSCGRPSRATSSA